MSLSQKMLSEPLTPSGTKFNFPPLTQKWLDNFLDNRSFKVKILASTFWHDFHARRYTSGPQTLPNTIYIVHKQLTRDHTHTHPLPSMLHLDRHDALSGVVWRITDELDTVSR